MTEILLIYEKELIQITEILLIYEKELIQITVIFALYNLFSLINEYVNEVSYEALRFNF